MTTHTTSGPCQCAWCLKEQGKAINENDSHGICKTHAAKMSAEHKQIRVEREQKRERR